MLKILSTTLIGFNHFSPHTVDEWDESAFILLKRLDLFFCISILISSSMVLVWLLEGSKGMAPMLAGLLCVTIVATLTASIAEWSLMSHYSKIRKIVTDILFFKVAKYALPSTGIFAALGVLCYLYTYPGKEQITVTAILFALLALLVMKKLESNMAKMQSKIIITPSGKVMMEIDGLPDDYNDEELSSEEFLKYEAQYQADLEYLVVETKNQYDRLKALNKNEW